MVSMDSILDIPPSHIFVSRVGRCSAHFSGASKGMRALTFERPVHPRVSARMQAETASGKAGKAVLSLVCSQ